MKRLLASCAALALAATSMLPLTAFADAGITLTYGTEPTAISAGETVTYALKIKNNTGVNSWEVLVNFDTDKLSFEEILQKNIKENVTVDGNNLSMTTKIQKPLPKEDQEGDNFPIVWAEGTATYDDLFTANDLKVPAEYKGVPYSFTGDNNGNPVAEIVFTANTDLTADELASLVTVSPKKAGKTDPDDKNQSLAVEIEVVPEEGETPPPQEVTVTLNATSGNLQVGQSARLSATVTGTDEAVTWTSSNADVATVDANGNVTAVGAGTATITASVAGVSASATVTVTAVPVEPTVIPLPDQTIVAGTDLTFDISTFNSAITPEMVAAMKVTIADTSVATYSVNGTVVTFHGVAAGSTTVSVTSPIPNFKFTDFTINVTPAGTTPTPEFELRDQTVTEGLTTSYNISNAILAAIIPNLEVESLDPSIATVAFSNDNASLLITGIRPGTVTAQVRDKNTHTVLGTFNITVEAAPVENEFTCDFKEKNIDLKVGDQHNLAIVVNPANYEFADDYTDLTGWDLVSSDPTVVKVDAYGVITALKSGEVTITATNPDYNGTLKCTVVAKTVFPVYVPSSPTNPGNTASVKPSDYNPGRSKVTPYVNAIVDSESKAASVIAATGGEMDTETGNAPAIAAAALGLIALGFVVVARKKRHS